MWFCKLYCSISRRVTGINNIQQSTLIGKKTFSTHCSISHDEERGSLLWQFSFDDHTDRDNHDYRDDHDDHNNHNDHDEHDDHDDQTDHVQTDLVQKGRYHCLCIFLPKQACNS